MLRHGIVLTILVLVAACTSKAERLTEQILQELEVAERRIDSLQSYLNKGLIRNAVMLDNYASQLKKQQPENATLIDNLAANRLPDGPMLASLKARLQEVKQFPGKTVEHLEQSLAEAYALQEAAQPEIFNDALSDTVNVLADLSQGRLPRVQSLSSSAEQQLNASQSKGPGSQLVGNPQYGQWKTNSSGMSFWEWYGMYALFSNLTNGGPYGYGSWARNRPYSYYHDYGRHRYTKPSTLARQKNIETRTAKNYRSQGKRFSSPYAKQRSGASQMSRASKSRPSSGSLRSASSFRKSSSSSGRRGSARTNRGPSRGK
ncbi:hypothetical protein [Aliikangiella sp. IMCC44632]